MITLKTIVLPVDFSSRCAAMAAHARILARKYDAAIVAVHVMRPFQLAAEGVDVPSAVVLDWYSQHRPVLEGQLNQFVDIYLKNCKSRTLFREGDPATEIVKTAVEENADLIMLGTQGFGAFRRFVLGSVAAKVLNDSPVPVLTGTHVEVPADEKEHIDSILVAADLDGRAPELIAAGANLAQVFGAQLHLVHASPDDGGGASEYLDPAWRVQLAAALRDRLSETLAAANAEASIHVLAGDPAKVVRNVAEMVKADLVILGRHTDNNFLGRLRTHSYAIVRESPCPVLSL